MEREHFSEVYIYIYIDIHNVCSDDGDHKEGREYGINSHSAH